MVLPPLVLALEERGGAGGQEELNFLRELIKLIVVHVLENGQGKSLKQRLEGVREFLVLFNVRFRGREGQVETSIEKSKNTSQNEERERDKLIEDAHSTPLNLRSAAGRR